MKLTNGSLKRCFTDGYANPPLLRQRMWLIALNGLIKAVFVQVEDVE